MLRQLTRRWRALFGGRSDAASAPSHTEEALAARHDISRTYVERARALRARGLRREALATVAQATDLTPEYAQAWAEQGDDHLALGEREDARDCFELALAHAPDCVAARLGMSRMLRAAGDIAAAHAHILHALQIAPDDADLHFESALVMSRRGDVPGVITAYERVLELRPDDVAACSNLGLEYLSHSGDARSAQRCFERAVTLDPSCVAAQANLGLALEEQGDVAAAFAHYAKLIDAHPSESEYRWNRGLALLAGGDYARGWDDYELRNGRAGAAPRVFPFAPWQGAELPAGAALLIYGEQGVGDEIMFASCVPDLLARGMRIVIECDLRLAALYERSFPTARVHGAARDGDRNWLAAYPELAAQIAIGSLPRLTRRTAAAFPPHSGYLRADPQRVAYWRKRLADVSTGIKIGVTWRGGTAKTRGGLRSISAQELGPILDSPCITFIDLQRDAGGEPTELAPEYRARVLRFSDVPGDLDDMAALLQVLDGIVTVDNSTAHLAGALGCRTWIMLPHSADWRWLRGQATSPWYPSVTLCRQSAPGDWAGVVKRLGTELASVP